MWTEGDLIRVDLRALRVLCGLNLRGRVSGAGSELWFGQDDRVVRVVAWFIAFAESSSLLSHRVRSHFAASAGVVSLMVSNA
jgi:hypothetical protein